MFRYLDAHDLKTELDAVDSFISDMGAFARDIFGDSHLVTISYVAGDVVIEVEDASDHD